MRAVDVPEKFKELLVLILRIICINFLKVPNKVHNVICTGNVGSRDALDWLKSLSDNFVQARGDYDAVRQMTKSEYNNALG